MHQTLSALSKGNGTIEPPIAQIDSVKNRFVTDEQQDAHEFMEYVLSMIDEEAQTDLSSQEISPLTAILNKYEVPPHLVLSGNALFGQPISRNPFSGLMESTLQCKKCDRKSSICCQSFLDLSLSFPRKMRCTLEDCLYYFTCEEEIEGFDCEKCAKERKAGEPPKFYPVRKRLSIARSPESLCLHIRRLVENFGDAFKLNCKIDFPTILDLSPFCKFGSDGSETPNKFGKDIPQYNRKGRSPTESLLASCLGGSNNFANRESAELFGMDPSQLPSESRGYSQSSNKSSKHLYRLVSVIVHHGSHIGGHYTVYRRELIKPDVKDYQDWVNENMPSSSERWVFISDDFSRVATEEEVLNSEAYMLYYEKI